MESEILCPTTNGDSLIISDKMQVQQQEKDDANVAQKIQAECDKKFNDSNEANDANNDSDVISKSVVSDETLQSPDSQCEDETHETQTAEPHIEPQQVMNGNHEECVQENGVQVQPAQEQMQNGNHHSDDDDVQNVNNHVDELKYNEPEEPVEIPDIQVQEVPLEMDSLNVATTAPAQVEIVDAIEKTVEVAETIAEVIESPTKPESPILVEQVEEHFEEQEPEKNLTDEVKVQNGDYHTNGHDVERKEEVKTKQIDEYVKCVKENLMEEDEPVKNHYQPEKIESFGISVKEMVNDMPRVIEDEMKARESVPNGPRKGAIATSMDTESVRDAYNDIRADNSDTTWAVFKYEASRIICSAKGVVFDEFKKQFDEGERAYGYIRLQTGDELSKRHKFLFVTWIGPGVSVLKRAKMSIDKAIIKNVVNNFAVELQLETLSEFDLPFFIDSLNKASGANYGTGVREI